MVFRDISKIELNCKSSNIKFSHAAIKRMRTAKYDQSYKSFEGMRVHKGQDYEILK